MKKKILAGLTALTLIFGATGCQSAAKNFGGDYTLPRGTEIGWKPNVQTAEQEWLGIYM